MLKVAEIKYITPMVRIMVVKIKKICLTGARMRTSAS